MKFQTMLMACVLAGATAIAATPALAQTAAKAPASAYKPPRNSDGHPDLQGVWTNVSLTPLQRAATYGDRKVMTPQEVAAAEKRAQDNVIYENQPTDPNAPPEDQTKKNCNGAGGRDCGYNAGWKDETTRVMRVGGEPRTSFITSTPNGRIPARVASTGDAGAQAARAARLALQNTNENSAERPGQNDNPETRGLGERCLAFGNAIGPMMPNGYYNNNIRIGQSKDAVAIEIEMVHDVRVVRIGDKMSTGGVGRYFGESVGHWEGDTLVVETANYHPSLSYQGSTSDLKMTEKFTRTAADRIRYEFTLSDPKTWATPWGGEYEFYPTTGDLYEYACHEGNYGLEGILAGARHEEQEAAAKKTAPPRASR